MKKLFLSAFFVLTGMLIASAQAFEGVIEFQKQTATDTVNYIYYIKGDKVRLDEIGNTTKKVSGSFIIDLKTSSMLSLSHERKLYFEQSPGSPVVMAGKIDVNKTANVKTIQGNKCTEYVVKNADEKTQVTYWMATGNYGFFGKLLKVLNRKDKSTVYIQKIPGLEGMFPFLSVQKNLDTNKDEVRMEVTKFQKKTVDSNLFEVPKDYQKFQK